MDTHCDILVVTKKPTPLPRIQSLLKDVNLSVGTAWVLPASESVDTRAAVKAHRGQLLAAIDASSPTWVLALGNEALLATTGHSGIMKHRGKVYPFKDRSNIKVMGTLNPAAIEMSPGYERGFKSDLTFFSSQVNGIPLRTFKKVPYKTVMTNLSLFLNRLQESHGVYFDLEANKLNELDPDSVVISISCALWDKGDADVRELWAIPLFHPESPFKDNWQDIFCRITKILNERNVKSAHNGKFDCRWTDEHGEPVRITFCTMLAAHMIDENRSKSLENLSRDELGVKSWKIDTRNLLNEPLKKVLRYNALDSLNGARLYFLFRGQLKANPRLARLFLTLVMPVSNELVVSEREGVWIDNERLQTRWAEVKQTLADIDKDLIKYVPTDRPIKNVNFNVSDFLRWWVYDYLELPILERTETGAPSLGIAVKQKLRDAHPVMPLLIERAKWIKYAGFFKAYDNLRDARGRIHTTFKLHGTVTGRLSSGKGDPDKVIGKPPEFSVNLQQVPQDPFVKSTIGAPPGRVWINADFSQIEFRLAAMLAPCLTAIDAYYKNKDIHAMMAARITGKTEQTITKIERTCAKPPNFLFLYGGYPQMFIETAWREYGIQFTEDEARKLRREFFRLWKGFYEWHERERELVRKTGQVITLFGRVRRLPNVYSEVDNIRWQAERQAINTRIQSPASDMTQLAYLLISQKLREEGLDVKCLGTVHDSLMFDALADRLTIARALPIIKDIMENLPTERMFGFKITIPIKADISIGQHWGEDRELSDDEIYDWSG